MEITQTDILAFKLWLVWVAICLTYYYVRIRWIDKEPPYFRPRIKRWFKQFKGRLNGR